PQRSVPPVLTAAWAATVGFATVVAAAGAAAVVAAGLAAATVGCGGAGGADVGAGGAAPGPQAASRLAPVAETSMASADRRLRVNRFGSGITSLPPGHATVARAGGSGQSAPTDQPIGSAESTIRAAVRAPQSASQTDAKSRNVDMARVCAPRSDQASAME